jgi:hypothetical protein
MDQDSGRTAVKVILDAVIINVNYVAQFHRLAIIVHGGFLVLVRGCFSTNQSEPELEPSPQNMCATFFYVIQGIGDRIIGAAPILFRQEIFLISSQTFPNFQFRIPKLPVNSILIGLAPEYVSNFDPDSPQASVASIPI